MKSSHVEGVKVSPGDLVVADDDGVVIVPKEKAEEMLSLAEEKQAYEHQRLKTIQHYISEEKAGYQSPSTCMVRGQNEKIPRIGGICDEDRLYRLWRSGI
ncbi:hypothetical protein ACEQPO_27925 [Bacillus sp. SL00103]